MPTWRTLDDVDVAGKTVLVRIDADVPLNADHEVTDDTRLREAVATLQELCNKGAKVIIMGHAGRPKGKTTLHLSLQPMAKTLGKLLNKEIKFAVEPVGRAAESAIADTPLGGVVMLENLRFNGGEERNDPTFAGQLANLCDVYVNDAFATAHRAHASSVGVVEQATTAGKPCLVGRQLQKEIETFETMLDHPKKPFLLIVGGAKVSSKIGVIRHLMKKCDQMIIGGAMANTFLVSRGITVGHSLYEPDYVDVARDILAEAGSIGCRLLLPSDFVVAKEFKAGAETRTVGPHDMADDDIALDIGEQTARAWGEIVIPQAATILWNGPLGAFETKPFDKGTVAVAKAMANAKGMKVAGGGDTLAAINKAGTAEHFNYLSTAGGALLEFLEGKELPAIAALEKGATKFAA